MADINSAPKPDAPGALPEPLAKILDELDETVGKAMGDARANMEMASREAIGAIQMPDIRRLLRKSET